MKLKRQNKILELINTYDIDTQEELARRLVEAGFKVTQATVSRDIKELNLSKVTMDIGRQKYVAPIDTDDKYIRILSDSVISIDCAGNIMVIKTVSGIAMAVGAAVDALNIKDIIGCIAGDDTVMCVVKKVENCDNVKKYLEKLIVK